MIFTAQLHLQGAIVERFDDVDEKNEAIMLITAGVEMQELQMFA